MVAIEGISQWWLWSGFIGMVLVMLWIDLGLLNKKDHIVSIRESLMWVSVWISLAMVFCVWLYFQFGSETALTFLTGYLIEESLSMDNLFVFLMIFSSFNIPRLYQHRVLFWGIIGAIVMRGLFIGLGTALVSRFDWVFYFFGAILIWGAYRMQFQKEKKFNPKTHLAVRIARKLFPVTDEVHGHDFFIVKHGRRYATILFVALVTIELTDVVFATDSIPAIFAITTDPFIVFTSNIFAILGLRALYFAIAGLHAMFAYLKTGLAIILAFVGVKMLLHSYVHVSVLWSLGVIVGVLAVSIIASVIHARSIPGKKLIEQADGEVRVHVRKRDVRKLRK